MMSYPARNLDWYRNTLSDLLAKTAAGLIQPPIAAEVPLHDAERAHEMLEAGGVHGKIVLTCSEQG
jgi:NADPH:quinone reductase-like Zn-dependent oxidoreductase